MQIPYTCALYFNHCIYTYIQFLARWLQLHKIFNVCYGFVAGHQYLVCDCSRAPISMVGVVARLQV
jgi:hypothetical protein